MVLLLFALLLAEALTGIYVANDVADEGPLTELVPSVVANLITDLHTYFWDALLAAMILHVIAILLYGAVIRHDLVTPMITGWKTLPPDTEQPHLASAARAAASVAQVLGEVAGAAAKTHSSAEVVLGTSRSVETAMADLSRHIEAFLKGVAA